MIYLLKVRDHSTSPFKVNSGQITNIRMTGEDSTRETIEATIREMIEVTTRDRGKDTAKRTGSSREATIKEGEDSRTEIEHLLGKIYPREIYFKS